MAAPRRKKPSAMSWQEFVNLPVHPAAEIFPMRSDSDLEEATEEYKENGLL
jgi:hypothetical protein